MGWELGYITGGLRVETTEQLISLIKNINLITNNKTMMNFGPYSRNVIEKLQPYISGMGSAIESFDEELHNFICPSKPLKALLTFLQNLKELNLQKLITIILGLGEKKEDVFTVIENIKKYDINTLQLCFLKPQENTIFSDVPPPNMDYMAWWIAQIRIHCPKIKIKIALVKERIDDLSLLLEAGANAFSRFIVFQEFNSELAKKLEQESAKANRILKGNFTSLPELNIPKLVNQTTLNEELKQKIIPKAEQYYNKLKALDS